MINIFRKFNRTFARFARRKRLCILLCGLFGFFLPFVYWQFQENYPLPKVHDEFSYLLAADTFAHFNITNPTHQFWQFFEAPHILSVPTYTSKYPPMQGIFLALGQVFFGHPAFGIWLGCGLAAAAICWMLQAWTKPKFALLGTLIFILFFGFFDYWAHTYWGGMIACAGGALFFGAFRRILRKPQLLNAIFLIGGAIILANSRPFEGFVTILPASVWLFIWLMRERKISVTEKFTKFLLPIILLLTFAASAMLFYNKQITGEYLKMPYSLHTQQYMSAPLFLFQPENKPTIGGNERLRQFDALFPKPQKPLWSEVPQNFLRLLLNVGNTCFPLILFLPFVFSGYTLLKKRLLLLVFGSVLLTFTAMSFAVYSSFAHYFAPIVPLTLILMVEGFRRLRPAKRRFPKLFAPLFGLRFIILLAFVSLILQTVYADKIEKFFASSRIFSKVYLEGSPLKPKSKSGREEIRKAIEKEAGKHLIFVEYAKNYSLHDESVYNLSAIDTQKIVWAHDLGTEENQKLIDYYGNKRTVWKVLISWEKTTYTKGL